MANRSRQEVPTVDTKSLKAIVAEAQDRVITADESRQLALAIQILEERLPGFLNSERVKKLFGDEAVAEPEPSESSKKSAAGHGRNPAEVFTGADKVDVPHPDLQRGCPCPECLKGKLSSQNPSTLVRIVGQAPLHGNVYNLERLRCNLCGESFTAAPPEGVGSEKYDASAVSMVAVLKYGAGMPFNRIEAMQQRLGVPVPTSTQWDLVADAAEILKPVYQEMVQQAAQGEVLHHDDTSARVIDIPRTESDTRTGVFTTGMISATPGLPIALFFTGTQHAGENLKDLLMYRGRNLSSPIIMCDALSRNVSKLGKDQFDLGNCLVHGRRNFVEAKDAFPEECRHVLEVLGQVYANDREARESAMDPKQRLQFHQKNSEPLMKGLYTWINGKLARDVEHNSHLGKALRYMIRHWKPLTLFLRTAGAPLDNNICERSLKMVVLHRKNALFYRTLNGAETGDLFMSLIQTCILQKVNPFEYLTELLRHAEEVQMARSDWMPWSYRETLAKIRAG